GSVLMPLLSPPRAGTPTPQGPSHPAVRTRPEEEPLAVVPRPAATVALLRDGRNGLEAYLQRRPLGRGFAGGLWVFPGGRGDEADRAPAVDASWAGPPPAVWAQRLGLPVGGARGRGGGGCRAAREGGGRRG